MSKKLTDKGFVHSLADSNSVFLNCGNEVKQMSIDEFRVHMNDNDNQVPTALPVSMWEAMTT